MAKLDQPGGLQTLLSEAGPLGKIYKLPIIRSVYQRMLECYGMLEQPGVVLPVYVPTGSLLQAL